MNLRDLRNWGEPEEDGSAIQLEHFDDLDEFASRLNELFFDDGCAVLEWSVGKESYEWWAVIIYLAFEEE